MFVIVNKTDENGIEGKTITLYPYTARYPILRMAKSALIHCYAYSDGHST